MIHRAPFGSMERFVAILIEHTGGNFPIWLTPTQVKILCISDKFEKYAKKVSVLLENSEIRALVDNRNETVGKKIREAELEKVPLVAVLGKREVEAGEVSVRSRAKGNEGVVTTEAFVDRVQSEVTHRGGVG